MKKIIALFLSISMVLSLAACGGSPTSPTAPTPPTDSKATETPASTSSEANIPTVAAGKKGTMEVWSMFTGADGAAFPDIVAKYNATNPDYTVQHRAMVAEDLYLKLQMAVASGEGVPDIAMNHIERVPLFAEEGRIVDITPYLEGSGIKKDDYNPKAWSMTDLPGGHYGIPLDVHSYIMWVNMDLYEKYGLKDLDDGVLTWDELTKTAEVVKKDGIIPIGLSWYRCLFLGSYAQLGGTLSNDGINPSFNNDIAKKVLAQYQSLTAAGNTQINGDDSWKAFMGGSVLYEPEGVWMYNAVKDSGLNIKAFDFPVFDTAKKGSWTSSHQFTIPTPKKLDPDRIKASLDFIKFVEQNAADWSVAGLVPAAKHVLENPDFEKMPQYFLAQQDEELKIYEYKYFGYAAEALDKVLQDVMFGTISIEEGLKKAEAETRDKIDVG